jgi:signal transduction histidine kinase
MILIVDDKAENLFSLQKTLESHNLDVDTAFSGEEALKKILKHSYDLIILDVQMPGMDGFELAETISGYSKSKDIPILFLSAISKEKKFITKGYASGGMDYITKPVDPDILLLKVKNFIRLSRQTQALSNMQKELQAEIEMRKKAQHELDTLVHQLEKKVLERTRELVVANQDLESSNHDLQQFASVASHDLKEPLRKIQIFSSILSQKAKKSDPGMIDYLDRITTSANRMEGLIHDLLNFSRLSMDVLFETADLNLIVREILTDLELQIREKKAIIEASSLPVMDIVPGQMRQVFQNLISNAIKFSKPGVEPKIDITASRVKGMSFESEPAEAGAFCRITITDNGIGFNEQYLDRIFTIFQRLHSREEYEGTGIGLAITRKIIDRHNGIITARSKEGEGAAFTIVLPMQQGHRR